MSVFYLTLPYRGQIECLEAILILPIAQLKHLQDVIEGFDVDFRRGLMEAEPSLLLQCKAEILDMRSCLPRAGD